MDTRIESALEIVQRMDGFLASVLYALDGIVVEDNLPAPARTNSKTVSIDRKTLAWSPDDLAFVLAHEALHVVAQHGMRCGDRDGHSWNVACDKMINRALEPTLPFSKPESVPMDRSATPLSEEELYDAGPGKWGQHQCFVKPLDDASSKAIARRIRALAKAAKTAGRAPGYLDRLLPVEDARLPLPTLVANIMARGRDEYSFRRPSRASRVVGVYMPSLAVKSLTGTVMISVDTSGSMDDSEVGKGIGGIQRAARSARMARLVVVQQDTQADVIYDGPPAGYRHKPMRRNGGTDFRPLMELARKIKPRLLACITDLAGPHGGHPGCRVVWITSNATYTAPPFGTVCRFQ